MNKIIAIALFFSTIAAFAQEAEIKVELDFSTKLDSHKFKMTNESDSLLCIFFSGFHGQHNSTHYKLPVIDSVNNTLIYRLDFAKQDLLIDAQCKYLQILTIKPHQTKTITIDVLENSMSKKIDFYYIKSILSEEKFMKKLPKRCLGHAFNFRQSTILIPKN